MNTDKISVLIIDDHPLVREGLRSLLNQDQSLSVVGDVGSTREAKAQLQALAPQLLLIDISLSGENGIQFIREIKSANLPVKALVISMHEEPEFVIQSFKAGADGYVVKNSQGNEILHAIHEVWQGSRYLS